MYKYLVTTKKEVVEAYSQSTIVMLDGTVPGWIKREGDLHFDHHRPGGEDIQIWEIPSFTQIPHNPVFVTTQVDADACVAAAWLQLINTKYTGNPKSYDYLSAIAYDCDHLGLPEDPIWDPYRSFAAKAVAAMKEVSKGYPAELGLPPNRKDWTEANHITYASFAFQKGTEWLVNACLGRCSFPGEMGEADSYFAEMESLRPTVYENCRLYKNVAIFDQRSIDCYVDPRLLVDWARENNALNFTLSVRDGANKPNAAKAVDAINATGLYPNLIPYSYTLGNVPLHPMGCPNFSDNKVWEKLADLEDQVCDRFGIDRPETKWGGRNAVGGSGWRDPVFASPEKVIDCVLETLTNAES